MPRVKLLNGMQTMANDQTSHSEASYLGFHCLQRLSVPIRGFITIAYFFYAVRPRGYKTFFMLNSAEHEIFSANKHENANNSWHFHIYQQRTFHAQLCLARKNLQ